MDNKNYPELETTLTRTTHGELVALRVRRGPLGQTGRRDCRFRHCPVLPARRQNRRLTLTHI